MLKPDIHPKYDFVVFKDASSGFTFLTRSTKSSKETVKWKDGKEYPLVTLEITSDTHPFFTGKQMLVDSAGRVEKFMRKYGLEKGKAAGKPKQEAKPEAKAAPEAAETETTADAETKTEAEVKPAAEVKEEVKAEAKEEVKAEAKAEVDTAAEAPAEVSEKVEEKVEDEAKPKEKAGTES